MKNSFDIESVKELYWSDQYNMEEVAKKLGVSFWMLYSFMLKNNIPRRNRSEANYIGNKQKLHFEIKDDLTYEEEKLKLVGVMLYWAEGSKSLTSQMVDFSNSDSDMIKIFVRFLRQICGARESRLRVYLYAYSYQNIEQLKDYWNGVTNISKHQFLKPYVREGNPNLSGRKLPYGLVHIRYSDIGLLELILKWIEEFKNSCLTK